MMTLFLGDFTHTIHERQGGLKVGKFVSADEVMLVDDLPLPRVRQLSVNLGEFVSL
jgi:hypothetical protein